MAGEFLRRAEKPIAQVCCRLMVLWLAGYVVLSGFGQAASPGEIRSLRQFLALEAKAENAGLPVRLRAVVVCADAGWHQLYLHDGEITAYLNADDFITLPQVGQEIEIVARTGGPHGLVAPQVRVLGLKGLPPAKPLSMADLGRDHGEWIQIEGRVLSAENSRGRLALLLQDGGAQCLVYVLGGPLTNDCAQLLDSKVSLCGINASKTTGDRLESPMIFAPGLEVIRVAGVAGPSPSQIPVTSIRGLLNRELGTWTNEWVHLNGLTVAHQSGHSITVKDPTGAIRARIIQLTEMRGDERVDLWGYLRVGAAETYLDKAFFTVARAAPESSARVPSGGATEPVLPAGELTHVARILQLSREQAAQRLPVLLRGVMTYADPGWRNGFIQEQGDAVYVDLDPGHPEVQSGQWVELHGSTSPGGFAPEVLSATVKILGVTNWPSPARVDLEDLANGRWDAHWVEMEGVVRRVDEQAGHANLSLRTPKGRFNVIIPGFERQPVPTHLIDALVSVQGACTSELNSRRQLSGITLHTPGLSHLRVLEAPSADPFATEARRIDAVATFDPARLAGRRVKIEGVVTLRVPGQGFIVQDLSGGLRVQTRQTNEVRLGDRVEVLGFPVIGSFSPCLEEAVFRLAGAGEPPNPKRTTPEEILLRGASDGLVVEIEARLLQSVPRSASPQLVMQDGPIIFTAQLEDQTRHMEVPALLSGSRLRLTGVCAIQGGERHEPVAFRLMLRSPRDIDVRETPPWWTARHTLMLAGGLMLAMVAALSWVTSLRRQVQAQTELVRQKLEREAALEARFRDLFENANDMLYTHDGEGRFTSINQAGERFLQLPRQEVLSRHFLDFVAPEQRAAARQWLDQVRQGVSLPAREWEFAPAAGQRLTLEISARVIAQAGQFVEVEGIARDITERKRLEQEVMQISDLERRRIGHDLHDSVCQQLAGLSLMTSTLAEELEERGLPESGEAAKISDLLNEVIDETRSVARGLFPARLEENGLAVSLEKLAATSSELFGIECEFTATHPPEMVENAVALHLYYIVREAIANASKHGGAKNVWIKLEPDAGRYLLSVEDNGGGFTPPAQTATGMGLRNMFYRARVIGATLTLHSEPGSGTTVCCHFHPVSRELPPAVGSPGHSETSLMPG